MPPPDATTTTDHRMVLSARGPYRVAAGILALPCIASAAVPFQLDIDLVWQLAAALTCVTVGALFGAVALRGTVSVPTATVTTSETTSEPTPPRR